MEQYEPQKLTDYDGIIQVQKQHLNENNFLGVIKQKVLENIFYKKMAF